MKLYSKKEKYHSANDLTGKEKDLIIYSYLPDFQTITEQHNVLKSKGTACRWVAIVKNSVLPAVTTVSS